MKLHLVAFGKLKTPGLRDSADYYLKLLGGYQNCQEHELKPISAPDKNPATTLRVRRKESDALQEKLATLLGPRGVYFLLDEEGKALSTEKWSEKIASWQNEGVSEVALCIGGSLGFDPDLKKKAAGLLSLGPHTLPHELARVVLLEQLYRASSLLKGHPYHNPTHR